MPTRFFTLTAQSLLFYFCLGIGSVSAEPVMLSGQWHFFPSTKTECQQATQHSQRWRKIDPSQNNHFDSREGLVGCFVVQFDWDDPLSEQWLYIDKLRHSDISWINGIEVGRLGQLSKAWQFQGTSPQSLFRLYAVDDRILSGGANILSIATTIGFSQAKFAKLPGGAGLQSDYVLIGSAEDLRPVQQRRLSRTSLFDAIILTLSVVDIGLVVLLYWIALITLIEFPAVAVGSLVMTLGVFGIDLPYLYFPEFAYGEVLYMLATLTAPIIYIYYFFVIYRRLHPLLSWSWGLAIISAIFTILLPWASEAGKDFAWYWWYMSVAAGSIYALIAAIHLVIQRRVGAIPALIGIVIFIIMTPTHRWPDGLWLHYNIQIGTLVFRYCLLLSVFLRVNTLHLERQKALKAVVTTEEAARTTIARELHDGVGQNLAAAKLHLSLIASHNDTVQVVRTELDAAVLSLRRAINGYSDKLLESNSLLEAIVVDCRRVELIYPVSINVAQSNIRFLPTEEDHLFRIFQEYCSNAITHGAATKIWVSVGTIDTERFIEFSDNGTWKEASSSTEYGHGRQNIVARADAIGASRNLTYGDGQKTRLKLKLKMLKQ